MALSQQPLDKKQSVASHVEKIYQCVFFLLFLINYLSRKADQDVRSLWKGPI